jgi:putative transposase
MARKPRGPVPPGIYHVTIRSTAARTVYRSSADRAWFLRLVADVCTRFHLRALTYCLMTTHYHALVRTTDDDVVQPAMQRLNGMYGRWLNWRYDEHGHLFADRYKLVRALDDAHLLELFRYIALNPVRAGIVRRPEDWRWSGYRTLLGLEPAPLPSWLDVEWPLRLFGATPEIARARLREYVAVAPPPTKK